MLRVLETFSGIGAQAKALERQKIEHEIVHTADWDINAIVAYDIIHNGKQNLAQYENLNKQEIIGRLKGKTLSPDGKSAYKNGELSHLNILALKSILAAIERSRNLVSITDMSAEDVPENLDLLTYSFPCQDLSIAGFWHGNMSGIDRAAKNRSGMLWEVERILKDCVYKKRQLPKMLLMENVNNILAPRHMGNFKEWIDYLKTIGYYNKIYKLNAKNFGIPQNRCRVFMLSVYLGNNKKMEKVLDRYFESHNLENIEFVNNLPLKRLALNDILRLDYSNPQYLQEANESQLNDTPSRIKIIEDNDHIYKYTTNEFASEIKTITTKQDRNPNSGVIEYNNIVVGKVPYRYLTARECFIAMGFDEMDYDRIINNNIMLGKNRPMFSMGKLIKMAGNSIVVNVLEAIFIQANDIYKRFFINKE